MTMKKREGWLYDMIDDREMWNEEDVVKLSVPTDNDGMFTTFVQCNVGFKKSVVYIISKRTCWQYWGYELIRQRNIKNSKNILRILLFIFV